MGIREKNREISDFYTGPMVKNVTLFFLFSGGNPRTPFESSKQRRIGISRNKNVTRTQNNFSPDERLLFMIRKGRGDYNWPPSNIFNHRPGMRKILKKPVLGMFYDKSEVPKLVYFATPPGFCADVCIQFRAFCSPSLQCASVALIVFMLLYMRFFEIFRE